MTPLSALLLLLSILLSAGRNIFSKGISGAKIGSKHFFFMQFLIFGTGSIVLLCSGKMNFGELHSLTVIYALIYTLMLLSAQWCYTAALKSGQTGICSTVYSMGFIFPTLSGALFWNESLGLWKILGILLVIPTIILSGLRSGSGKGAKEGSGYIIPLIISMVSSGGLGILQKLQQSSPRPEQKSEFLLIAFSLAACLSLAFTALGKKGEKIAPTASKLKVGAAAVGVGLCFALCNILNTTLAGMLDSAIFFPTLNIGAILLSLLLGFLIYKEKPTRKDIPIPLLGIAAVLLINL